MGVDKDYYFFDNEFDMKVCIADMMHKVTFGQAEALGCALRRWDKLDELKNELELTREYIHDNGLEWDLLSYSERKAGGSK